MIGLDGARCDELDPGFVETHFDVNLTRHPELAAVALAVCAECPAQLACRDQAVNRGPQGRGVVGGVSRWSIRRARAWQLYELGYADKAPAFGRPGWLVGSEAVAAARNDRQDAGPEVA